MVSDLSPIRHQAITWINADLFQAYPQDHMSVNFELKYETFHSKALENVFGHLVQA